MKKINLMLLIIIVILCSCDKTEYKLNKIYGKYTLKTYTVNGIDSTNLCNDSIGNSFEFFYDEDHDSKGLYIGGASIYNHYGLFYIVVWELSENGKMIKIESIQTNNIGTGPFGSGKKSEWTIQALTKKKFYIKTNYNGNEYYLELLK